MNDDRPMQMVRRYKAMGFDERLAHVSDLLKEVDTELGAYVFGISPPSAYQDVLQETRIAIFKKLNTFRGDTRGQFFAWCRRIAWNKASDEFRRQGPIRSGPHCLDHETQKLS